MMPRLPKMTTVVALEQGDSHYSDVKPVLLNARFRRRCGASWGRSVLLVLGVAVAALALVAATAISREGVSADEGLLSETLSAGWAHACAISSSGVAICWGSNTHGETDAPEGEFVQVSGGEGYSCGLRSSGAVECWGSNTFGAAEPPVETFSSIGAGNRHACGVTVTSSVLCWGIDSFGQASPSPGRYSQVRAGNGFTCALTVSGTAKCWGLSDMGQSTPPGDEFVRLSAGYFHACGVTLTGSVECWGDNAFHQSNPPTGDFQDVRAGFRNTCAISTLRDVVCWGEDNSLRTPPPGTFSLVTFVLGYNIACGLRTSGAVSCWGGHWDPDRGETGLPGELTLVGAVLAPTPIPPPSIEGAQTSDANSYVASHYVATATQVEGRSEPAHSMLPAAERLP